MEKPPISNCTRCIYYNKNPIFCALHPERASVVGLKGESLHVFSQYAIADKKIDPKENKSFREIMKTIAERNKHQFKKLNDSLSEILEQKDLPSNCNDFSQID